jgi:hypothetical protein
MHNTGTWNSDLVILFLGCLLLPIGLYFLRAFFEAIAAARPIIVHGSPKKTPAKRKTQTCTPTAINISLSLPDLKGWSRELAKVVSKNISPPSSRVSKPKSKVSPKPKSRVAPNPKKKAAPTPKTPLTSQVIEEEAISGLCNMGYKKRDASKLVKGLSSKRKYDSTESLIKDCFMCIS